MTTPDGVLCSRQLIEGGETVVSTSYTSTRDNALVSAWNVFINDRPDKYPATDYWAYETVKKEAPKFLLWLVLNFRSPDLHNKYIKASTLKSWLGFLVYNIWKFVFCNGRKAGMKLLVDDGMYKILNDQMIILVSQYDLRRDLEPKFYCGHPEVPLMLGNGLRRGSTELSMVVQNGLEHAPGYIDLRSIVLEDLGRRTARIVSVMSGDGQRTSAATLSEDEKECDLDPDMVSPYEGVQETLAFGLPPTPYTSLEAGLDSVNGP